MKSKNIIDKILTKQMTNYVQTTLAINKIGEISTETTPYLNATYKPRFYASSVAKLVGKCSFQSETHALYDYLKDDKFFKPWFKKIWQETNNNRELLVFKSLKLVESKLKTISNEVSHVGKGAENVNNEIKDQVNEVVKQLQLEKIDIAPEIIQKVTRESISRVNMNRGSNLESLTLDTLQVQSGYIITGKNDKKYSKDFGYFVISGKVDGIDDKNSCIIEVKNRTRFMHEPPLYDRIQCLIYMVITGMTSCILVEHFPGGQIRETQLEFNQVEFDEIHEKLIQITLKIRTLTKENLAELIAAYDRETFKM